MTDGLLALDVAILPPPEVAHRAIQLSAALPRAGSQGLELGPGVLPHVTLTQQFVRSDGLDRVLDVVNEVLRGQGPIHLAVTGGGREQSSVWMTIEPGPSLRDLHVRLMHAIEPFEEAEGDESAFFLGDARPRDVAWVAGYRRSSSFTAFSPHITLGHAAAPPEVEPFTFSATTIAACRLARFCSCRHVLRRWSLEPPHSPHPPY